MLILGLDPGLRATGWGVVDVDGPRLRFVACGAAVTRSDAALAERLNVLHAAVSAVLTAHRPDEAAVEETFVAKDPRGALALGQARGVALLAPAQAGVPVAEYAPTQVKKTVVGVGRADKGQVEHMVRRLLPGADPASADAADALAVAICHGLHAPTRARFEAAARAQSAVARGGARR